MLKFKNWSYELWQNGSFGNMLLTWNTLDEIIKSGHSDPVTMRVKRTGGGGFYKYRVPIEQIPEVAREWGRQGVRSADITFNENAPDDYLLIQGEFSREPLSYNLTYSTEKKKMRDAMKNPQFADGLRAKLMMQHFCDPSSYDDLMELLEIYQDHTVEFSTYSIDLGHCRNRNTVIWEVRGY